MRIILWNHINDAVIVSRVLCKKNLKLSQIAEQKAEAKTCFTFCCWIEASPYILMPFQPYLNRISQFFFVLIALESS